MADGSVKFIKNTVALDDLVETSAPAAGGEVISSDAY